MIHPFSVEITAKNLGNGWYPAIFSRTPARQEKAVPWLPSLGEKFKGIGVKKNCSH